MKRYILKFTLIAAILLSLTGWKYTKVKSRNFKAISIDSTYHKYVNHLYSTLQLEQTQLSLSVFEKSLTGFLNLKNTLNLAHKSIITIVNFDQPSIEKRLYVIDLNKKTLLLNTWVAHGQRSGHNATNYFSNLNNSYASSLGFYVTGEIYYGTHGKSLKLDGLDKGFNDNARKRDIVLHGASYVSKNTINALGRLGRSQGCPAVAPEVADKIINTIAHQTILFINKSDQFYNSKFLDENLAAQVIINEMQEKM